MNGIDVKEDVQAAEESTPWALRALAAATIVGLTVGVIRTDWGGAKDAPVTNDLTPVTNEQLLEP